MIPRSPQPEAAAVADPEFSGESLLTQYALVPGAARLTATNLLPDDGGPRMMHVHFLKSAGPPAKDTHPHREIHCAALSLTTADADALAKVGPDLRLATVQSLVISPNARLLGWQSLIAGVGATANVKRYKEIPACDGNVAPRGNLFLPDGLRLHSLGETLEVTAPAQGIAVSGKFTVDLTAPRAFSRSELEDAASTRKKLPAFEPARLSVNLTAGEGNSLKPGVPLLHFPASPKLPPGHPETGRRHVIVSLFR